MIVMLLHGAGWILRPRRAGRSRFGRAMIRVRCQRGQGHVGHAIRSLLRLRLLLRLDRRSLSVHARLWHLLATTPTGRVEASSNPPADRTHRAEEDV